MQGRPRIAFFGSSLVSAYWNGAATYYRGIIRALQDCGIETTFYEPDAFDRQAHRDMEDPPWARVVVYTPDEPSASACLEEAASADFIVKASGVGVLDVFLEREVLRLKSPHRQVIFWDVDAPATLDRMMADEQDPLRAHVPHYDVVLTYGGGPPVVAAYERLGARACVPVYNALSPETHHAVAADPRLAGDLGFLGNRMPDREGRVEEFFFSVAATHPNQCFVLGGSGWGDRAVAEGNVKYVGHVYTRDHNAFNCSTMAVLNISRESMARYGYSPATRIFEAAGAEACIITDHWEGIAEFLEPGSEILVARSGAEVAEHLAALDTERARRIGQAAFARVMAQHTYRHRAMQLESLLTGVTTCGAPNR